MSIAQLVDHYADHMPYLPLIHITNSVGFERILKSGSVIKSKHCSVFQKNLIYTFYGKPTYEIAPSTPRFSKSLPDTAVAIAINLDDVKHLIEAVYPFDTGGAHGNNYEAHLSNGLVLADFELTKAAETPAKLVNAYYGDNDAYYQGRMKPKNSINIQPFNSSANAVWDMCSTSSSIGFDERVASVEVQLSGDIYLDAIHVLTVVAPMGSDADPDFQSACQRWKVAKPRLYYFGRSTPQARTQVIFDRLGEFYNDEGLFP